MHATFQLSSETEESSLSTTSALNVSRGAKTATLYGWKYNHYCVVVEGEKTCEFVAHCVHPAKRHCRVFVTQRGLLQQSDNARC